MHSGIRGTIPTELGELKELSYLCVPLLPLRVLCAGHAPHAVMFLLLHTGHGGGLYHYSHTHYARPPTREWWNWL
jgi:hypothetical protein